MSIKRTPQLADQVRELERLKAIQKNAIYLSRAEKAQVQRRVGQLEIAVENAYRELEEAS